MCNTWKSAARRSALLIACWSLALMACRPKPPEAPPAPVPQPPEVSAPAAPPAQPGTPAMDPLADAVASIAPPAAPSSPGVSAAVTAAAASREAAAGVPQPDLAKMTLARAESSKIGVPVDLRYQVDGDAQDGRPVTVHLAAVPRVSGSNLSVSIKEDPLLQASAAPLRAQKATLATPYRQQLSVTRLGGAPAELRVLVTMEMPEGLAFSWFGVPLTRTAAGKQAAPDVP